MSFAFEVNPRETLRARYLNNVLRMLQSAVEYRVAEGKTKKEIANCIGKSPSVLSRIVNGHVRNITVETIADILYATGHDPADLHAEPVELIDRNRGEWVIPSTRSVMYSTSSTSKLYLSSVMGNVIENFDTHLAGKTSRWETVDA